MKCKAPEAISLRPHTFCTGCVRRSGRLIGEIMEELGTVDKLVVTTDVACGAMNYNVNL